MALNIPTKIENSLDNYSLDAYQVRGGYGVVEKFSDLASLPAATIVNGSLYYAIQEQTFYAYNGTTWEQKLYTVSQVEPALVNKADKDLDATQGNIAVFDTSGNPVDGLIPSAKLIIGEDEAEIPGEVVVNADLLEGHPASYFAKAGEAGVVDTNLDPTSQNPVTNAVLTDAIGYKASYEYVNTKVSELEAKIEQGGASKEYVDTQVAGAKSYTDTKTAEAKTYTDTKTVEAKSYTDTIASSKIGTDQKGVASGVASLDSSGKVPTSQLPEIGGNNVQEFDSVAAFPTTGASNTLYIAKDTNKTYRWSGTAYVVIVTNTLTNAELTELATSLDTVEFTFDVIYYTGTSETFLQSYTSRKYMTWRQFVNSSYNTGNAFTIAPNSRVMYQESNITPVRTNNIISADRWILADDVISCTVVYKIPTE